MTPKDVLLTVLSETHADAVIDHRRAKRTKLTTFAASLLAREFGKCANPDGAAEEMILRGWTGFKAGWVTPDRPRNSMDAAQNLIARINEQDREDRSHQGDYRDVQLLPSAARH